MKLGDICKFQSGGTPSKGETSYFNGNIPWITTVALNGSIIDESNAVDWITEKAIEKSAAKIVPANSVMVGTRVGVGKVAINKVPMSTSQDIISLLDIDESKWNKEFICKFILGKENYLNSQARGATIKGIKIETLAGLQLPDIPLEQQCKIAAAIDAVNNLIALRKEQLAKLDQLVKSRFIELFGEPLTLLESGKTISLEKVFSEITVGFVGEAASSYAKVGIPYLRTQNVRKGYIDYSGLIYVSEEFHGANRKSQIKPGDIVVSRVGVNRGMAAVIPQTLEEANIANCLIIKKEKTVNSEYLAYYLNMSYGLSPKFGASVGSAQGVINTAILKKWEVFLPPYSQQEQFAAFVEQTDKSKLAIQQSLEKLELLKKSLMQEYFE